MKTFFEGHTTKWP